MIEAVIPESEITYTLTLEPEYESFEGNFATGDDDLDQSTEEWIRSELNAGNEWAWCSVKVTASWNGFDGSDYLGMCSYASESDFREGDYFEDMKAEARTALVTAVESAYVRSRKAVRTITPGEVAK